MTEPLTAAEKRVADLLDGGARIKSKGGGTKNKLIVGGESPFPILLEVRGATLSALYEKRPDLHPLKRKYAR